VIVVGSSLGGLLAMGWPSSSPPARRGDPERCRPDIDAAGFDRIRAYIGRDHPQPDWPAAIRFAKETFHTVGEKSEADWRRIAEGTFRQGPDGRLHVAWDPRLAKPLERPQAIPDLWRLFRRLAPHPHPAFRGALSDLLPRRRSTVCSGTIPPCFASPWPASATSDTREPEARNAIDDFLARFS